MDSFTRETIQRYKSDLKKLKELERKINAFQDEASRLLNILGAYERILKHSLGQEAFKEIHQEVISATTSSSEAKLASDNVSHSETNSSDLTITDIILKVIGNSGSSGITAAQVFEEAKPFGIGIEKRNTVYGTLSRLNTSKRIKKVGKRYFLTQDQS
jgi:hypothetical protein